MPILVRIMIIIVPQLLSQNDLTQDDILVFNGGGIGKCLLAISGKSLLIKCKMNFLSRHALNFTYGFIMYYLSHNTVISDALLSIRWINLLAQIV